MGLVAGSGVESGDSHLDFVRSSQGLHATEIPPSGSWEHEGSKEFSPVCPIQWVHMGAKGTGREGGRDRGVMMDSQPQGKCLLSLRRERGGRGQGDPPAGPLPSPTTAKSPPKMPVRWDHSLLKVYPCAENQNSSLPLAWGV